MLLRKLNNYLLLIHKTRGDVVVWRSLLKYFNTEAAGLGLGCVKDTKWFIYRFRSTLIKIEKILVVVIFNVSLVDLEVNAMVECATMGQCSEQAVGQPGKRTLLSTDCSFHSSYEVSQRSLPLVSSFLLFIQVVRH